MKQSSHLNHDIEINTSCIGYSFLLETYLRTQIITIVQYMNLNFVKLYFLIIEFN